MSTEATPSSSRPGKEASGGAEEDASHNNHCFSKCSTECSSCYKVTRTGRPYGTRCECPDSDDMTEGRQRVSVKSGTAYSRLCKTMVRGACFLSFVLLVVVGLALAMHYFGKVTLVWGKHEHGRKWMFIERMRGQPQPASQPLHTMYTRLQKFATETIGRQSNAAHSHRFHKVFSTLERLKKNLTDSKERNLRIAAVLLASGMFNVAAMVIVTLFNH